MSDNQKQGNENRSVKVDVGQRIECQSAHPRRGGVSQAIGHPTVSYLMEDYSDQNRQRPNRDLSNGFFQNSLIRGLCSMCTARAQKRQDEQIKECWNGMMDIRTSLDSNIPLFHYSIFHAVYFPAPLSLGWNFWWTSFSRAPFTWV